tara:strand:+ start:27 stop:260 length:234 start_codon:yes stop_codon:yes gene_type:complete
MPNPPVKEMPRKQQMAVKAAMAESMAKMKTPFKMKAKSPVLRKLTSSCKAMAKKKFDVYPSAYANMYASKMQGKGKC